MSFILNIASVVLDLSAYLCKYDVYQKFLDDFGLVLHAGKRGVDGVLMKVDQFEISLSPLVSMYRIQFVYKYIQIHKRTHIYKCMYIIHISTLIGSKNN